MTENFRRAASVLSMLVGSAALSFYALTHVLQTRLLFGVLLIAFAFVAGGIWLYLPWSRGPVAHALPSTFPKKPGEDYSFDCYASSLSHTAAGIHFNLLNFANLFGERS